MKTKILLLLANFLFLFGTAFSNGTISGHLYDDASGNGISSANVKLSLAGISVSETKTNKNAYFEFTGLKTGIYTVSIKAGDYESFTYEKISIQSGQTYKITAFLTPKLITKDIISVEEESEAGSLHFPAQERREKTSYNMSGATGFAASPMHDHYVDHNTDSFDFIDENGFKSSLKDPLSTFSIDVDRAAYAVVRRMLNESRKPYVDAVRIEEMINYFDYDYENPKGPHPFSSHLEIGDCPWNKDNKLLMIGIQGESIAEENIPPSNLVFLIDVSGSMYSADKLPLVKKAFNILVDKLRPEDKVSIVVYSGAAGCVLPSTGGDQKGTILKAIDKLEAGGSTAGGAGIKLAYDIAVENYIENGNNRVIIASDGDFNVGVSSNSELERLIESKRESGVYLTILGFGMGNYKDSRFKGLSTKGNGNYAYVDNIMEANKIFGHELWGTLYTIANDVKIQIEFNPAAVKEYRLIGYEKRMLNKEDFNNDEKDAGDIGSGHTVTAIYELVLQDGNPTSLDIDELNYQTAKLVKSDDLMTLKIRYKKPGQDVSRLITSKVTKKGLTNKHNTENFALAVAVAEFGMLLRDSEFKANSSYDNVLKTLKTLKNKDEYGYRTELISMVEKAKLLSTI
jgi:Ca-activated chloride channel homolog